MARSKQKRQRSPAINPNTVYLPRLVVMLNAAAQRCGGFQALAEQLSNADRQFMIDRRKLSRIGKGRNVALKLSQLVALDELLTELGIGRLLDSPKLLSALAQNGHVTFLLGTYPRAEHRDDISGWDLKCVTELIRGLGRVRTDLLNDIRTVPSSTKTNLTDAEGHTIKHLLATDGPSIVALGSPKACSATEIMLANFFGVEPFQTPDQPLPFCFYWPKEDLVRSAFALPYDELDWKNLKCQTVVRDNITKHWGFRVGDKLYLEQRTQKLKSGREVPVTGRRTTYGIVAARRFPNGSVQACIAGMTGPASLAISMAIMKELAVQPIPAAGQGSSPVWWVAFGVDIKTDENITLGDPRCIGNRQIIGESHPMLSS